jgi:putative endonuclease
MNAERASAPFGRRRAAHLRLGRRGEGLAVRLLRELGADVLVRNVRYPGGEIDIVAREHDVLCFVEVKTRRRAVTARPADAVGQAKRRRIIRAAHSYLRELGWPDIPYRFDVVEILLADGRVADARYWRGAFTEQPERGRRFPSIAAVQAPAQPLPDGQQRSGGT